MTIMAKKTGSRTAHKEMGNQNRNHETLPDEIALRDEILELKRQMMVLKRTNEQYLVKLRKYEDEAKRKDKQVEQLMDPRKNADVTKVLSTKGAAILMNLKDQNNALIQMILNKDLHIRRLVAEIKMSKLYATTRKNESYRAEINRLRNLLIKSQEALKENIDVQQQQQEKSICAGGNSFLEFSSSSDQSSPRDLDELRVTIMSLESHIQHSNDLLAKKNQEISSLTNEVNFLRKCFRYKTYKNKTFDCDAAEYKNHKFSTTDFTYKWSKPSTKTSSQNVFDLLKKNQEDENLPHSAPPASSKCIIPSMDSTSKYTIQSSVTEQRNDHRTEETAESALIFKTNQEIFEKVSILGNSLSHNLAPNELLEEKKIPPNPRTICTKVKWMKALSKYRELKKLKRQIFTVNGQSESGCKKVEIVSATEFSKGEANEREIEKNVIQTKSEDLFQELESPDSLDKELNENITPRTPNIVNSSAFSNAETPKMCQNIESSSVLNKSEEYCDVESIWSDERQQSEKKFQNIEETVTKKLYNAPYTEGMERKNIKSLREVYRQSMDSSFDSENSYSMKQEVRQVEVEVQINSASLQNDSDQSGNSISENNLIFEYGGENGGNRAPDVDFNDDDDVIVREK